VDDGSRRRVGVVTEGAITVLFLRKSVLPISVSWRPDAGMPLRLFVCA
jgi:hypothetical protein